jgi:hypothetical protein
MKTAWFPIVCPGKDSQINNHHRCLPKLMTATLINDNFPACLNMSMVSSSDHGMQLFFGAKQIHLELEDNSIVAHIPISQINHVPL